MKDEVRKQLEQRVLNPRVLLSTAEQALLFEKGCEDILLNYLSQHYLDEENQHLLFEPQQETVMDFFMQRWGLASFYEKKLCSEEYREKWLCKYIEYHAFTDSQNEMLLFENDMEHYRRFYISQRDFHHRPAEQMLFKPEYQADLHLYICMRRSFFKDLIEEFIETASPSMVALYRQINRY